MTAETFVDVVCAELEAFAGAVEVSLDIEPGECPGAIEASPGLRVVCLEGWRAAKGG